VPTEYNGVPGENGIGVYGKSGCGRCAATLRRIPILPLLTSAMSSTANDVGYAKGPVQVHGHERKPAGSDYGGRVHAVRKMTGKKLQKKPSLASADGGFFVRANAAYCAISTENPMKTHVLAVEKKLKKVVAPP